MSHYKIEKHKPLLKPFVLYLVFRQQGYSENWMVVPDGRPSIAYVVLEQMVAKALQASRQLQPTLFAEYRTEVENALYQKLVDMNKPECAQQRARQRADEIASALEAIVVEEKSGRVVCLNKNEQQPVATFDEATATVSVDGRQWTAAAAASTHAGQGRAAHATGQASTHDGYDGRWGDDSGESTGPLASWWSRNQFVVWASVVVLGVLPACMIGGMLQIKKMAEQANTEPETTLAIPADSLQAAPQQADTIGPAELQADTIRPDTIVPDNQQEP